MTTTLILAWRSLRAHPLRTTLSALIVSFGVAMTIAAEITSSALLATLTASGGGDLQITHGFLVEQFDLMLNGVSLVLLAVAAFLIFNSFAMTITQRQQQIGLLRALGMTRRQVLRLLLVEALLVGGIGTAVGLLAGPPLGSGIIAAMRLLAGEVIAFGEGQVTTGTILAAAALGLGVTLAAVLLPARRAARIPPLAALRPLAAAGPAHCPSRLSLREWAALAAALLLWTAVALTTPGSRLQPPWNSILAGLGILLWLACLGALLPRLIRLTGSAAGRGRVAGRLAGDNVQRAPTRAALTALALAIGLMMIVVLTGGLNYAVGELFGYSFAQMAERDMWAVFPFDLEQGTAALGGLDALALPPAQIAAFRDAIGDRAQLTEIRFADVPELSFLGRSYFTFLGEPAAMRGGFFTFEQGSWETAVPLMTTGCGALIAPAVAQRLGAGLGDTFTVSGARGPVTCTVAGIGAGFVNASIVGAAAADALGATDTVALVIAPRAGIDADRLLADMRAIAARSESSYLTSMTDYAALVDDVIVLFGAALNGILLLAVVTAALGVVNTMIMNVAERRQELGLLRAVGGTRRQVTAVVTGEAALLGLAGALFGLLAGLGIVTLIVVVYGASSWGVPDLALWPAAGRALRPALRNGLVGLVLLPLVGAAAARFPARALLRGTAVEALTSA